MKKPSNAAFSSWMQLKSSRSLNLNKKNGSLFAYAEVVNQLLDTYATGDVIADTVSNIYSFTQVPSISAMVNSDPLWTTVLLCARVYVEAQLKELFIEGLQPSNRHSMRAYLGINMRAFKEALARNSGSLRRLQVGMTYAEDVFRRRQPNRDVEN